MAPRSRRNTTRSGNTSGAGEATSRLDKSQREAQQEIATYVKMLKKSIPKPRKKASDKDCTPREKTSQDKSTATIGNSLEKTPSFVTQENAITMLKK
ncbi:hypothetical protein C1H46_001657 [Malus baccata]|uniref:Uncharacterized protein n=1 Tax=Malus baccata TaxID=106549 RepID=A0A540NP06_MALBA|nr:hypothetical protein C1H46_001657 [Malus baccata]